MFEWAKELPRDAKPALVVYLERAASEADEAGLLQESIHDFFARRSTASRRALRDLFRRGRMTLLIAVLFLTVAIGIVERLAGYLPESRLALVLREGTMPVSIEYQG